MNINPITGCKHCDRDIGKAGVLWVHCDELISDCFMPEPHAPHIYTTRGNIIEPLGILEECDVDRRRGHKAQVDRYFYQEWLNKILANAEE